MGLNRRKCECVCVCVCVLSGCLILSEGNHMGDTNMLFFLCVCEQYFYLSMFLILVYAHNAPIFIYFTECCICKWSSFQCVHMHFVDTVCTSMSGRCVCMCVCVVCLPLLLWVSNASWLWYLWATIFEWCLLTVMCVSKASDRGGDQAKVCMCVQVCVCSHVRHRHYNVIQHDSGCRLEGRGSQSYSHLAGNCVCVSMTVCVCGRVINSALKSHWHFSPSNLRHNNTQPWSIWHFTAVRGETSAWRLLWLMCSFKRYKLHFNSIWWSMQ